MKFAKRYSSTKLNDEIIIHKVFRIDPEYYTFISGALVSIPLTLLFELSENYLEIQYWFGLVFSIISSFFCYRLSILLKEVNEKYKVYKGGVGKTTLAWNTAIKEKEKPCVISLTITIVSFLLTVIFVFWVQFIDSTASLKEILN